MAEFLYALAGLVCLVMNAIYVYQEDIGTATWYVGMAILFELWVRREREKKNDSAKR